MLNCKMGEFIDVTDPIFSSADQFINHFEDERRCQKLDEEIWQSNLNSNTKRIKEQFADCFDIKQTNSTNFIEILRKGNSNDQIPMKDTESKQSKKFASNSFIFDQNPCREFSNETFDKENTKQMILEQNFIQNKIYTIPNQISNQNLSTNSERYHQKKTNTEDSKTEQEEHYEILGEENEKLCDLEMELGVFSDEEFECFGEKTANQKCFEKENCKEMINNELNCFDETLNFEKTRKNTQESLEDINFEKFDFTKELENETNSNEMTKKLKISDRRIPQWTSHWTQKTKTLNRSNTAALKRSFSLPSGNLNEQYGSVFHENGVQYSLPSIITGKSDSMPRIKNSELVKLLCYSTDFDQKRLQIIDCRYTYEYIGGHIKGAININNTETLLKEIEKYKNKILIFYCEFSSVRAPKLAKYLRNYDRFSNNYPQLDFPEIYILNGGYKEFFSHFKSYCEPEAYKPME